MESKTLAEPVLVGRERELEELRRHLNLAIEGKGNTVFISAEAGIGKTRLVRDFLESAKQEKDIVLMAAWCLFSAEVPYFPFIEAFSGYYSALHDNMEKEELELNSWLKWPANAELTGHLQNLSPQALKDQTFVTVARTIHSIATRKPVVLLLEDIHWADSASLALVHYIARTIYNSEKVLLIATFRSEELTSNSEGYPHQLVQTLSMMRREDLFSEIKLLSLDRISVSKMAESMLGDILQQDLAEMLAIKSEGNPLFVVESIRMLHEQQKLIRKNNQWHVPVEEIEVPSKIRDIIIQRLACLNNVQKRILDAASVIGDEFEAGLLSAMLEQDSLDVMETLNAIAQSTSIIRVDEERFRFDHARSREIIYEALAIPLRRGYHGKIAEILNKTNATALPLNELAFHYARAGNKDKAIKFALAAAKEEYARWSNVQAIQHFRYVLQNISEGYYKEKTTALEGLGDAYVAGYLLDEAIKTFDELAANTTGSVRLRAIRKAMGAAFSKGDKPDLLLEYAKKAEALTVDDRLEMARIRCNRARAKGWSGRGDVRMELMDYESALIVFEEENSLADVAEALWRSGAVCLFFEDLSKKGLIQLLRSAAIFKEIGYIRKEIQATVWVGDGFLSCGLYSEAERKLNDVLSMGEKMDVFGELAGAHYYLATIAEREGNFPKALSNSLKCLEYSEKTDLDYIRGFAYASLTRQHSKLGNLNLAKLYLDKLRKLPQEILSQVLLGPISLISKGVYLTAKGSWEESNQVFEKLAMSVRPCTERGISNFTRPSLAWVLEKQGRLEDAEVQWSQIRKLQEQAMERFGHTDIQLSVMLPRKLQVGEQFIVRLDLVNASVVTGTLVKIEGLIPLNAQVISACSFCRLQNGSLELNQKKVEPFEVQTIKITLLFAKDGVCKIEPMVFYINELGVMKNTKIEPIITIVKPRPSEVSLESVVKSKKGKIEFKSEAAEKAFNYLFTAFEEDYLRRRLSGEKSGWRTLMEVVKKGHVSKHSMYGQSGRGGEATAELKNLGLIESRHFLGARARGGKVLKIRVTQQS